MEKDIIDTIYDLYDQSCEEKWDLDTYRNNILNVLYNVYSKSDFHLNIIDQIICSLYPKFNTNNRYDLRINRHMHNQNIKQLNQLLELPKMGAQKTIEWKLKRHDHINASEANAVLSGSRNSILIAKSKPFPESNNTGVATEHGVMFEPISNEIHSHKIKKKIYDFESIEHSVYRFIAASPDGITEDGVLVEYKNPKTRKIIGVPKPDYWVQTQLQMEVTNLRRCHYVECSYNEYLCLEDFIESKDEFKGVILIYFDLEQKKHIIYSKLNIQVSEYFSWYENEINKIKKISENIHIELFWWGLNQYSCFIVYRDKKWFNDTLPIFQQFWDDVLKCRNDISLIPIKHTKGKKLTVNNLDTECKINYDDY